VENLWERTLSQSKEALRHEKSRSRNQAQFRAGLPPLKPPDDFRPSARETKAASAARAKMTARRIHDPCRRQHEPGRGQARARRSRPAARPGCAAAESTN
jgi:hypothetical protein